MLLGEGKPNYLNILIVKWFNIILSSSNCSLELRTSKPFPIRPDAGMEWGIIRWTVIICFVIDYVYQEAHAHIHLYWDLRLFSSGT